MNSTIYKYQLDIIDKQLIKVTRGANLLTILMQKDKLCLWARVNKDTKEEETITIWCFGTGFIIPETISLEYISTIQSCNGDIPLHLFKEL